MARDGAQPFEVRPGATKALAPACLVAGLVFAGHLAFGANRSNLALGLCAVWFAALAALLISQAWARGALAEMRLGVPAVLLAAVLALAALSLTPFGVGGPHPVWSFAPGAPAVVSLDPYATRLEMLKLLALAAAFLVGGVFGADDERAKTLLRTLLVVGLIFAAWAFVDHTVSPNLLFGGPRPFGPERLSAAFGSGNTAATLFGALTLLNLTDMARTYESGRSGGRFHISHLQRMLPRLARPLLALALTATCLILTLSRAGLVATCGVAVVLLGAMAMARSRPGHVSAPLLASGLILGGLVVASLALNVEALGRRFSVFGADTVARSQIFAAHWAAFQAAPWSGYGLGGFARINGMIIDQANFASLETIGATHNVYIQWLEEAGAPGAVAMFGLVGLIAVRLMIGAARRRRMRSWILAIIAVLALFALHGASDYALQIPSMALFLSLLLGIGVGLSDGSSERAASATPPLRTAAQSVAR
jgi:O-antigen ligase